MTDAQLKMSLSEKGNLLIYKASEQELTLGD